MKNNGKYYENNKTKNTMKIVGQKDIILMSKKIKKEL